MRLVTRLLSAVLAGAILCAPCFAERGESPLLTNPAMIAANVNPEDYAPYKWVDDTDDERELPGNYRTMMPGLGTNHLAEDAVINREGLDSLRMSGSAQFNETQFYNLVEDLEQVVSREQIYVIDLRQESHLFADGYSVSWRGERDWSNLGKSLGEIEAEENSLTEQVIGTVISAENNYGDKKRGDTVEIHVTRTMTERELVESAGLNYRHFPCTDHVWPEAAQIDAFIEFYKTLPEDAWLHFHCVAGKGRTGALMCIYDLMRNPDVSLRDITRRQYLLGANDLLSGGNSSWTGPYKAEVALMITAFSCYVRECGPDGYQVLWSEWLVNR